MTDRIEQKTKTPVNSGNDLSTFAKSYESFNRIVNSLQRQYIDLKEDFNEQNEQLVETNKRLIEISRCNLRANEFLNSILSSLAAGVIAVDKEGVITHFNPAASALLGIPPDEPPGKRYRDIIPPGDPAHANALRAAETGVDSTSVEKRIDLNDGSILYLSVSTAILRNDSGELEGAVEVFHDLTRVKKMELEISRLNTLAALGEMAATIAHQVRNPLAGIGGFASLLKRDLGKNDPCQRVVDKIIRGVENLNDTVTSLLDYTRTDQISREIVSYCSFLKSATEQYSVEHSDKLTKVDIVFSESENPGDTDFSLRLDPNLFRQLFSNLITNAIEACHEEGTVTVSCRKLPRQTACRRYGERILIGLDETLVETVVADTGSGINVEKTSKLFSPFYTTRPGGNGLGLAIAMKIVKAHSGDILAQNSKSAGAEFTVIMPTKIHSLAAELVSDNENKERLR